MSKEQKIDIKIEGMSCASCSLRVENALKKLEGVKDVRVNLATEKAFLIFDSLKTGTFDFKKAVSDAGYKVVEKQKDEAEKVYDARFNLVFAWGFTLPLTVIMLLHMVFGISIPYLDYIYIVLSVPVLFISGYKTLKTAFTIVMHFSANMDVLIALGSLAAFSTGILKLLGINIASYSAISAMIMAFHLTGRYIEANAKGKASEAIKKLLELGAKSAKIETDDGIREVSIEDLKPGDIMVIKPGEKVPTDGVVIEGKSAIDESMATGESVPVAKGLGDKVIGATINGRGALRVRVEKVGENTFLAQVAKLVEECQGSKVPIQAFADKVVKIFVPVLLLIAGSTFAAWMIFHHTFHGIVLYFKDFLPWINPGIGTLSLALFALIAVLVIACPCALGLATPTALMVGSGKGASKGILFRSGEAISILRDIKVIVFDKTGTITKGKPSLTDVVPLGSLSEEELILYAASIEEKSEHPLAAAVAVYAKKEGIKPLKVSDFSSITGRGVRGIINSKTCLAGNKAFLKEEGIDTGPALEHAGKLENEGKSLIYLSIEGKLSGIIGIADVVKDDAKAAIDKIHSLGIKTVMITGDNRKTAEVIAKALGIDDVIADVLPDKKVEGVYELQKKYSSVAMVGDGINDAPALTKADVGISIGTGTDIAIESSDVTIVRGNLIDVYNSIILSRKTFKKIKQNLFWAFFYNLIAIPLAILGLLHPAIAEAAMAASSINVVTNSLRIRKVKLIS